MPCRGSFPDRSALFFMRFGGSKGLWLRFALFPAIHSSNLPAPGPGGNLSLGMPDRKAARLESRSERRSPMNSLLYVSTRRLHPDGHAREIDDIVVIARSRNATLMVTGALVATPTHYAQMLEGTEGALAELMASIARDERHSDIRLVHLAPKPRRELAGWSLAYNGESTYVSSLVRAAIDAPDFTMAHSFEAIRGLMLMFA